MKFRPHFAKIPSEFSLQAELKRIQEKSPSISGTKQGFVAMPARTGQEIPRNISKECEAVAEVLKQPIPGVLKSRTTSVKKQQED